MPNISYDPRAMEARRAKAERMEVRLETRSNSGAFLQVALIGASVGFILAIALIAGGVL